MTDDGLRALAASLARIEMRLDAIEDQLSRARAISHAGVRIDHADLLEALQSYFGGASFTAGTVLMAGEDRGELQDVLAGLIDYQQTPHGRAVQLGRLLARMPGLQRVGGRRGARLWRCG
jgi:hypothetical protein